MKVVCRWTLALALIFGALSSLYSEDVWATVDGTPVTRTEFTHWVKRCFRISFRMSILNNARRKRHFLRMYCYEKAILQHLAREGIFVKDDEIEEELARLQKNYEKRVQGQYPFARLLMERKITLKGLKWRIRYMLGVKKWAEQQATSQALREYFQRYKNYFGGELVRARQITILKVDRDTMEPYSEERKRRALRRIKEILQEIKPDGSNFEELARKYSESPSAKDGGDVGFFPLKGKMPRNFAQVAFQLKVGDISGVVETSMGYHIIYVTDKVPPQEVSYEDVEDWVREEFIRDKVEELVREIKRRAQIQVFV